MGWAGGSRVADAMIVSIQKHVKSQNKRKKLYDDLYDCLRGEDWDTVDEALGIDSVFDEVVRKKEPEWFDRDYWM